MIYRLRTEYSLTQNLGFTAFYEKFCEIQVFFMHFFFYQEDSFKHQQYGSSFSPALLRKLYELLENILQQFPINYEVHTM